MKKYVLILLFVLSACFVSLTGFASKSLRFGIIYFYPPFAFSTNTGYVHGFDVNVANAVCHQIGAECTFVVMPLTQMFKSLDNSQVDALIGAISITPERQKLYDFTAPYLKSTMSYVTLRKTSVDVNNLAGKRVGVEKNSTFQRYLQQQYGNTISLKAYDTNQALMHALSEREVDIILSDTPAAKYWVGYSAGSFVLAGIATTLPQDQGYGIVVKKGNQGLLQDLNSGLSEISRNGQLESLKKAYFK